MTALTAAGAGPRCVESGCTQPGAAALQAARGQCLQCCSAAGSASTRPPTGALLLGDAKITSTRDDHNHQQIMHSTAQGERGHCDSVGRQGAHTF